MFLPMPVSALCLTSSSEWLRKWKRNLKTFSRTEEPYKQPDITLNSQSRRPEMTSCTEGLPSSWPTFIQSTYFLVFKSILFGIEVKVPAQETNSEQRSKQHRAMRLKCRTVWVWILFWHEAWKKAWRHKKQIHNEQDPSKNKSKLKIFLRCCKKL